MGLTEPSSSFSLIPRHDVMTPYQTHPQWPFRGCIRPFLSPEQARTCSQLRKAEKTEGVFPIALQRMARTSLSMLTHRERGANRNCSWRNERQSQSLSADASSFSVLLRGSSSPLTWNTSCGQHATQSEKQFKRFSHYWGHFHWWRWTQVQPKKLWQTQVPSQMGEWEWHLQPLLMSPHN